MTVRGFVLGLLATAAFAAVQAEVAAQVNTQVQTEVPTALSNALPTEQQARRPASKVLVEGCIERAQRDGSVGGTGLNTTSSPNTADRDANSSETLDVFMLNSAKRIPSDPLEAMDKTTFALEGRETEIAMHTGHRVQITGTLTAPRSEVTSRSATAAGIQRIRVEGVKMISKDCKN